MVPTGDLVPGHTLGLVASFPNPNFKSEELIAFEGGYRIQWRESTTVDLAGFYNVYDRLRTFESFLPPYVEAEPDSHLVLPVRAENKMNGEVYGVELKIHQHLSPRWRVSGTYSLLRMELDLDADSMDIFSSRAEGEVPEHQATLQSSMDLGQNLQLNLLGRYVDRLPGSQIDSYTTLDARLAWQPRPQWEIAVVGQNLLEERHGEFRPIFVSSLPPK